MYVVPSDSLGSIPIQTMKNSCTLKLTLLGIFSLFTFVGCQSTNIAAERELGEKFRAALANNDINAFKKLTVYSFSDSEYKNRVQTPILDVAYKSKEEDPDGTSDRDEFFKDGMKEGMDEFSKQREKLEGSFQDLIKKLEDKDFELKVIRIFGIKYEMKEDVYDIKEPFRPPFEVGTLQLYLEKEGKKSGVSINLMIANLPKYGWRIVELPEVQ